MIILASKWHLNNVYVVTCPKQENLSDASLFAGCKQYLPGKIEHCALKAKPHPRWDVTLMKKYDAVGCFAVSGPEWCAETERPINYKLYQEIQHQNIWLWSGNIRETEWVMKHGSCTKHNDSNTRNSVFYSPVRIQNASHWSPLDWATESCYLSNLGF